MSQCLMNPNFWLLYGLSDIYIMLMDYSVVLYSLSNHVIINWFLIFLTLINIYWIYFHSYIIVIIVLNWCSWPWVSSFGIELDYFAMDWSSENWLVVSFPNSLYFMLIRLQLCCYLYGLLMVELLCGLLVIDMTFLALLTQLKVLWLFV